MTIPIHVSLSTGEETAVQRRLPSQAFGVLPLLRRGVLLHGRVDGASRGEEKSFVVVGLKHVRSHLGETTI